MPETTITAYRYRLYPTKAQKTTLMQILEVCRQVYNSLLNWREHDYAVLGKSPSKFDQQAAFPAWKKDHAELSGVFSQVLQNVAVRVDLAYTAFFRRVKEGETPGFPRAKGNTTASLIRKVVSGSTRANCVYQKSVMSPFVCTAPLTAQLRLAQFAG